MDIQGFATVIELDGNEITAYLNDASIDRTKSVMTKPTMDGTGVPLKLVTQKDGTISLNGQVDTVGQDILEATFVFDSPVSFKMELGDVESGLDAGLYSGNVTLEGETISTSADGTFDFALTGTGWLDYTPPA